MRRPRIRIHRNILLLGLVSLFTDLSSQMVYPLLPEFLLGLGAGTLLIGIIEGIAEATASLLKPLSGRLSDKLDKRKPFILGGYTLSSLSKPLFAIATGWIGVLGIRFMDRVGKAFRNPPRDAIISFSASESGQGRAFGIQRAFDRLGSVGGPLLALLVLYLAPGNLRLVFLWAGVPALMALIFIPFVREVGVRQKEWKEHRAGKHGKPFRWFVAANFIFAIGNSSNAFLILKAGEVGLALIYLPLIWAFYNLICALSSPLLGSLSDRVGRAPVVIASFVYYGVIYVLFATMADLVWLWVLFGLYGIHYGLSKGIFKAYISDITAKEKRGSAYGIFEMWNGIGLLIASILMGLLWEAFGSQAAFLVAAGFSFLGLIVFLLGRRYAGT